MSFCCFCRILTKLQVAPVFVKFSVLFSLIVAPPFVVNCNYTVLQQFWLPWIRQPTEKTVCNLWFPKIIDICDKLYSFSKIGMKSDVKCKMFWNKVTFCSHLLFWDLSCLAPTRLRWTVSHVITSRDFQDTVREFVKLSTTYNLCSSISSSNVFKDTIQVRNEFCLQATDWIMVNQIT